MQRFFSVWLGWVRVVTFFGVLFGLAIRIGDPAPIESLRNAAFDIYHQSKPRDYTPLPVAILDLDDRSIEEIGQWPWARTRVANLVRLAMQDGAVAIAFDIVFAETDRLSPRQIASDNPDLPQALTQILQDMPDHDEILADSFANARVIVGQTSVRTVAGNRDEKREMAPAQFALLGPDPVPYLWKFPDVVQNLPVLEQAASGRGMFTTRPDRDGVYRRVPIVMLVQEQIRLGLAPELLRVATGGEAFAIRTNEAGIEGVVLARQLVPTASDGTVWPYLTPSNQARYVSASDLLNGRMPAGRLAGHLVFVGTSAIGLEDFRATPLGVAMAGVEIHAQVLENIMTQSLLLRPNYSIAVELITTILLGSLVIVLAPALSARALISISIVLVGGYVSISYYLFYTERVLLDPSFPAMSTGITIILISFVNYLREERERREIRGAFGQYVSPDLVNQLSKNKGQLSLGGETRELTLLFSDVRAFTSIAEDYKDDPEALTALMNQFLTILSNAILRTRGTIDKFMGDAVMAFWNAPLDTPDHVTAACRSALQMLADVDTLNRERLAASQLTKDERRRKLMKPLAIGKSGKVHPINVGIGINTGVCVVGNMGSDMRFDYTALGDPVNVASRLEGQSRYYGVPIILGESTAKRVVNDFAIVELDMIRVVGKVLPENIFGLVGDETLRGRAQFQEAFSTNSDMLLAYRAQDWTAALAIMDRLAPVFDALDLRMEEYLEVYRARISSFRDNPPEDDWDGVFAFTKK
ncbi:CHASE2 domain-containing protein [Sulfitobacter sp.]|uniref:CHASE2 domain-containing protein n=1 Tax=Sulfitobacter sp. TaxID=1903071 RepID=UPI00300115A6